MQISNEERINQIDGSVLCRYTLDGNVFSNPPGIAITPIVTLTAKNAGTVVMVDNFQVAPLSYQQDFNSFLVLRVFQKVWANNAVTDNTPVLYTSYIPLNQSQDPTSNANNVIFGTMELSKVMEYARLGMSINVGITAVNTALNFAGPFSLRFRFKYVKEGLITASLNAPAILSGPQNFGLLP